MRRYYSASGKPVAHPVSSLHMKIHFLFVASVCALAVGQVMPAFGQGGDQFLDGIGETALIARYRFNGNERDASRNNLHGTLQGTGGTYVDDPEFGRVLSLPGGKGAYVQIPGQATEELETISVSAGVQLRSDEPGQRLFDFGRSATSDFFCTVSGPAPAAGYGAGITRNGSAGIQGGGGTSVHTNHLWMHLVVI